MNARGTARAGTAGKDRPLDELAGGGSAAELRGCSAADEEPASRSMHRNGAQHYQNAERNATAICGRFQFPVESDRMFR